MKKISGKLVCGVLAASMCITGMTGCGKLDGTESVATIDGENVTLGLASYIARDQQAQTESYYQMMAQSYGIDASGGIWDEEDDEGKTYGEGAKDNAMETIKGLYVLRAHADEYDVTISEDEQKAIDEAADAFMKANDASVLEELAVSQEDIVTYMQLMTYKQKMHDPMIADMDKNVSDDEANQTKVTYVYVSTDGTEKDEDGNTIDLTDDEKAAKKTTAQEVFDKVKASDSIADADMDALAKEVDENLVAVTADYTTAGSEDDSMNKAVIDGSAGLKDGELASDIVEGESGYYVIRMDLNFDEEGTANKKTTILSDRETETYDNLLTEWKDAATMDIKSSVWKKVKITDSKSFQYKTEEAADDTTTDATDNGTDAADDTTTDAADDSTGAADDSTDAADDSTDAADDSTDTAE